jgi:regulator of RNase E activity RraA
MDKLKDDEIYSKIILKIRENRISTTEIGDCLGKTGAIYKVGPLTRGNFRVGKVFLSYGYDHSNWSIHEQIREVEAGDIVIIEAHNCGEMAVFGNLVSKYILLYKRASGIVVNGYMRDAPIMIKENYPVWCKGVTPIGCYNRENEKTVPKEILSEWKERYEGSIAVCDDAGVVIIPKNQINKEFLEKLDFIELQEDIWSYCVNTKKWSTYDTICLKKYLNSELLPSELKEKFENFVKDK